MTPATTPRLMGPHHIRKSIIQSHIPPQQAIGVERILMSHSILNHTQDPVRFISGRTPRVSLPSWVPRCRRMSRVCRKSISAPLFGIISGGYVCVRVFSRPSPHVVVPNPPSRRQWLKNLWRPPLSLAPCGIGHKRTIRYSLLIVLAAWPA